MQRIHSEARARRSVRSGAAFLLAALLPLAAAAVSSDPAWTGPPGSLDPAPGRGSAEHLPEGLSASDWQGIRAAYEAGRHAMVEDRPGRLRARNPGQQWHSRFEGEGFVVEPDHGQWRWGLALAGWGRAGALAPVATPEQVRAEGTRAVYRYGDGLEEWFINDRRGLEHGFTVHAPPPGASSDGTDELAFALDVIGDLRARIEASGRDVAFVDGHGQTRLTYAGLKVWDADGVVLPARFLAGGDRLELRVQADTARYPITIDPLAQQAYLKASNTEAGDEFGFSVAVSGDTVVVGAPGEDSDATGVDGDQASNAADNAGAAYVFVRAGTGWSQQAYLKASNTGVVDRFGRSVAVSGDTVVVGAPGESSNATGVDGDQASNAATRAGAAYVFVRAGTGWSQQAYLKASNTGAEDEFGESVAVSGDTVVVGAFREDSSATGVDGDQASNAALEAGAAYVFVRAGTSWSQQAYLKASNTGAGDRFGESVAVSGDTVVVGARNEDSDATGVDGDQASNAAPEAGAAYVFVRAGTGWSQQAYLKASSTDAFDQFGFSVAISGDTVVVGAPDEDSDATGVDGDQASNAAISAGAAYVFVRTGTGWSQQAYLKASNTDAGDRFGESVAVSGDTVVVGALFEDSDATGVDGDQASNAAPEAGAAYVFVRAGTGWSQQAYLKASNTDAGDLFGESVAVSGDTVVVGAPGEDSDATGVDGDPASNAASFAGAAYVFDSVFTVGGTVSGLAGSGLVLQNNGSDDLQISANGSFVFATPLDDLSAYAVTVLTPPTGPSQTCSVSNGSGNLAGANVTNVTVDCVTDTFTVGGTVSGLAGSGLVLQNNGSDDLQINANGSFVFATPLDDLSA
ncbi:FG-GAP repeat protein, partial [Wenzhouxiangella sp. XN79A]|uniref:FG-GAP repeat protein n=1 Tax=Wenzhouxiangella sp. XN79A TaxID=2724193 RepID=UPI00197E19EB